MIQAMYNGVTGLRSHKVMMDVISNNIANINTVGFKAGKVSFKEMFNQTVKGATAPRGNVVGGTNPEQVGLGVSVGSIDVVNSQGSMQPTGKVTDMAIEGSGFFMLGDGSGRFYTRDGAFNVDSDGALVAAGSGLKVLGWAADKITGKIDSTIPIQPTSFINLPVGQIARQTTQVTYGGNLASTSFPGQSRSVSALIYDTLGTAHTLGVDFTKVQQPTISDGYADTDTTTIGTGTLTLKIGTGKTIGTSTDPQTSVDVTIAATDTLQDLCDKIDATSEAKCTIVDAGAAAGADRYSLRITSASGQQTSASATYTAAGGHAPVFSTSTENANIWSWEASTEGMSVGSGSVTFDGQGRSPFASGNISIPLTNGASTPLDSSLVFGSITQLAGDTTISATSQNGLPMGMLDNFTIGQDGIISGIFTNGTSQPLAQIALSAFSNPGGLSKIGNNMLVESSNSGLPQISPPAIGSMGKVNAGFLESSNVDLPTEFANMIVAQRGFQANSRVITTADQILQELVQLIR